MTEEIFNNDSLEVNLNVRENLRSIAKLGKIWVIVNYCIQLLVILDLLFFNKPFFTLVSVIISLIVNTFFLLFANNLNKALDNNNEFVLAESFAKLKIYFLIIGCVVITFSSIFFFAVCWLLAYASR